MYNIRVGDATTSMHFNEGDDHTNLFDDMKLLDKEIVWLHFLGIENVLPLSQVIQH